MSRKKWSVSKVNKEKAAQVAEKYNIDAFAALLLVSRNIFEDEDVEEFFGSVSAISDPFEIKDMDKAVDRINKAIFDFERIAVFGDYDADGVTATAVLYSYLDAQGADVFYYLPNRRTQGYGLSKQIIDALNDNGSKLIITVDNGISAIDEIDYANELGIDVIVTDHHIPGDVLPNAVAVVDPHRKDCKSTFKDFAGVGVAFKLVSAIEGGRPDELLMHFADFVAIGTVADVVPIVGENRKLVKQGLRLINRRERFGVQAIAHFAGLADKRILSSGIAFGIAPRINAAGRMGSADRALNLLLCEDADNAADIAFEIDHANAQRQEIEKDILDSVEEQIKDCPQMRYDRILVVNGEGWHDGVIGIVASRLLEKYSRPCIVISSDGDISKASGRSIEGFSLYDALYAVKDNLEIFGGHSLAAGFTIKTDNIESFRKAINEYAKNIEMPYPVLDIDCKINPEFIDVDILDSLHMLEPFGAGNRAPVFGLYEMVIDSIVPVGDKKQHLKINMHKYGREKSVCVMKFGISAVDFPFKQGDIVDTVISIERNEFLGELRVSLFLKDIRLFETDDDEMVKGIRIFEKICRQEQLSQQEAMYALPSRELFADIYKFIKQNGNWRYSLEVLWKRVKNNDNNYCRTAVVIEVFKELGLLCVNEKGSIVIPDDVQKTSLDNSSILKSISKQC